MKIIPLPAAAVAAICLAASVLYPDPRPTRSAELPVAEAAAPQKAKSKPKPGSEEAVRLFMRKKLGAMRLVMQGLVTEDYVLIRRNAEAMKSMGTQAEWNVVQGPIYGNHSKSFQRSAELLAEAAKEKNADAAMLVYMQMTLNCIECHRYVREPKTRNNYRID